MVGSRSDSLPLKPPPNQLRSPLELEVEYPPSDSPLHLISSEQNIAHLQARYNSIANLRSVHLLLQDPRVAYPPLRDSHSPRATLLPRPLDTTRHLPPRPLHIPSPKTRRLVKRLACSSFSSAESASGISATASQTRLLTGPSRHQPSPRPPDETHSLPFAKQPP